jgi:hypothetical protein
MPIVAFAFHEQVAIEKLDSYFASAAAAGGETRAIQCSKCSLTFAVILVKREDEKNAQYVEDIRHLIEEDCINSLHRDEYSLSVGSSNN